jgi:hypothetical protein
MTKQQLIDLFKVNPVVDAVTEPELKSWPNAFGDKQYTIQLRKIDGNKLLYEEVQIVVIDEGKESERAYAYDYDQVAFQNIIENYELRKEYEAKLAVQ